MAHKAFVLMETAIGKTTEVLGTLKQLDGVKTLDTVIGPYDIIVEIEKDDLNSLRKLIATQIHPMDGVRRVVSCMAPCIPGSVAASPFEIETTTPEKVLSAI